MAENTGLGCGVFVENVRVFYGRFHELAIVRDLLNVHSKFSCSAPLRTGWGQSDHLPIHEYNSQSIKTVNVNAK